MKELDIASATDFVNSNIVSFHQTKLDRLKDLDLKTLLKRKNPYLFKAKNITTAASLVESFMDAFISSSEEKIFGDFLEELAVFISGQACGGSKSGIEGIDLEFVNDAVHYLVSIKSGPNWGNSGQHKKQEADFSRAVKVLKQSKHTLNVQPVLGICYGRDRTTQIKGYMKAVGQNFWYLISGNRELYTDIIEPIGYRAKEHNDAFNRRRGKVANELTRDFIKDFCPDGDIDWKRLVEFNSGNLDLP